MKNIILFSVFFFLQNAFADKTPPTTQSSTYGSIGDGIPNTITAMLGKRIQSPHHEVDFGISGSTFIAKLL